MNVNADFYAKLFKKHPELKKNLDQLKAPIHPAAGGGLLHKKPAATSTTKKKKKPQTRAEKMKAQRDATKAHFEATKKAQKAKGQAGMTLKQRQAADVKASRFAAAKKHDAFQKKHKRGKYRVTKK